MADANRVTYKTKFDYILNLVGLMVGFSNVWRFPYICYKNGGGAFILAYLIFIVVLFLPLAAIESALGQYSGRSAAKVWHIIPFFKGLGYSVLLFMVYWNSYLPVMLAWSIRWLYASFSSDPVWMRCNNAWNTESCVSILKGENTTNSSVFYINSTNQSAEYKSSVEEFFNNYILGKSGGLHEYGAIKPDLLLCLAIVWVLAYFSVWKGISWTSKIVYFTATTPFLMLLLLVVRGATLEGAAHGMKEYLNPNATKLANLAETRGGALWNEVLPLAYCLRVRSCLLGNSYAVLGFCQLLPSLLVFWNTLFLSSQAVVYFTHLVGHSMAMRTKVKVWTDAASQVLFSFGTCTGALPTMSMFDKYNHNYIRDMLFMTAANAMASILAGVVCFTVLGHLAFQQNTTIDAIADKGPGLAFVVYPTAMSLLPQPQVWCVLFFITLLLIGFDSLFVYHETFVCCVRDIFPQWFRFKYSNEVWMAATMFVLFLCGMTMVTPGGIYVLELLNSYAVTGWCIFFIAVVEFIAVGWVFGSVRLCDMIQDMTGYKQRKLRKYFHYQWRYVGPIISLVFTFYYLALYRTLKLDSYVYPTWANVLGWITALSSSLTFPIGAIWVVCKAKGDSLKQKFIVSLEPKDMKRPVDSQDKPEKEQMLESHLKPEI